MSTIPVSLTPTPQEKINKNISRYEFTAVYTHPHAKADIVLVHGLNGHPQRTWTAAANEVFWPADLLPASLKGEHANVLVYGYNADVYSTRKERGSPSDNFVHQHAQSLVTSLTQFRKSRGTDRLPIVWVAHSLGGIVTKRALLYSNDVRAHHQEDFRSIFVSTYGIVFLGTPHTGSDIATWGRVLQHMSDVVVPRRFFETESVLLKTLKKDNETLQSINSHFLDIYQRFRIHMVHENHTTDLKGTKVLVVDAQSASPQLPGVMYYGIEATHSGMCKFESENAPGYLNVSTAIREWVADSPEVIEIRWEVEEDDRRLRANLENFERTRPYERALAASNPHHHELVESNNDIQLHHSPTEITAPPQHSGLLLPAADEASSPPEEESQPQQQKQPPPQLLPPTTTPPPQVIKEEPLFIHPESFRPNSFFIGREDELRGLHEMLVDRKRRSEGTSAVLIQCLPGGGKTHLARQYVFQHKADYPGGVYWVRAKSRHEMEYWFWRIARNEALRGLVEQKDVQELRDPRRIVEIVRKWLNTQTGWLLVLDGIQFDTPGLHEFIPDAKHTSLIYTSTERAVTGDPRFDNPQVMELGLLTAREAQDLLLLEMDKKKPWSADDQAKALELVQLMGRLPLMIHVAAQHLKATREPLARYLKSYKSRPKAGGLPAYKAVRDQLERRGATAALNLISILVFFDQHIPVEMLTLGLTALDNITPVKTCSASHRRTNLSNTLSVLIAFALIERTESDDISPTSSRSSKRSFDKPVEYLDLLRIHSVVQAFFIDSLSQQKQVHFWLERAAAVWCRSYDEAHQRIQEDPAVGLPDDYRRFLIHGQKLLQNLQRFERRSPELLAAAQAEIESRLVKIQGQIDQLSHAIQTSIIEGLAEGAAPPASVFERSSTMSETDSTTATLSHHDSQTSWGQFTGGSGSGDDHEPLQSPSAYDSVLTSPPRWPIPYPNRVLMPPTPMIDDDEGTVVPPAAETPTMTPVDALSAVDVPGSPLPGNDLSASLVLDRYEDWQEVIPHHRVIKRNELRRYHDRAGAWRDRSVGDPRVGLSLEVASGSLQSQGGKSRSPSRHRVTAQSDAEMELNKIRQAALAQLAPLSGPGNNTDSAAQPQPQPIPGRNPEQSPTTDLGTSPVDSLSGLAKMISSPTSWKAAMKKLTNNLVTSPSQSTDRHSPIPRPSSLHQSQFPPEDDILVPPGPIFRGSRTANSSPGSNSSPFPPPSFSAAEAISADEYLQAGLPVVIRRWETEEAPYPSRFGESPEQTWSPDPLSFSYPAPAPARGKDSYGASTVATTRGRGSLQTGYQPLTGSQMMWTPGAPSGYTSQPMSRDPSHQSMSSGGGGQQQQQQQQQQHAISPVGSAGSGTRPNTSTSRISPPTSSSGGLSHHPSSPQAISNSPPDNDNPRSPIGTAAVEIPVPSRLLAISSRHRRRPSYTETEPSPRLDAAFPDIDTSYQRWEQLHANPAVSGHHHPNRTRTTTRVFNADTPQLQLQHQQAVPGAESNSAPTTRLPLSTGMGMGARWQRTISRGRGRGSGRSSSNNSQAGRGRSQSLSPSPSARAQYSPQHHPHPHPLASASASASASGSPQLLPPQSPQLLPPQSQSRSQSPELRGIGSFAGSGSGSGNGSGMSSGSGGGEAMVRSPSGGSGSSRSPSPITGKPSSVLVGGSGAGIRLADGRILEFAHLQGGGTAAVAAKSSPPLGVGAGGRRRSVPNASSPLSGPSQSMSTSTRASPVVSGRGSESGSGSGSPTTKGEFGLGISQ